MARDRVNLACPECGLAHNAAKWLRDQLIAGGVTEYCMHDGRIFATAYHDVGAHIAEERGYTPLVPHEELYTHA